MQRDMSVQQNIGLVFLLLFLAKLERQGFFFSGYITTYHCHEEIYSNFPMLLTQKGIFSPFWVSAAHHRIIEGCTYKLRIIIL